MAIWFVEFSNGGFKIRNIFVLESISIYLKETIEFRVLSFGLMGHHFSNKVIYKLILSKNVKNKNCAPKLVFFNEKNGERFR